MSRDIRHAADVLKSGGIIVYPTETVYGIGCDPFNTDACERIQRMKGRPNPQPMLLLAHSIDQIEKITGSLGTVPMKLAHAFWPGPLTMIIRPDPAVIARYQGISRHVMSVSGQDNPAGDQMTAMSIAFRVTSNPVAAEIIEVFGGFITSTSANLSGQPPVSTYENALEIFSSKADIVIGDNSLLIGKPSTLVDVTTDTPLVIREGSISQTDIKKVV